jgi:hypothetical protein
MLIVFARDKLLSRFTTAVTLICSMMPLMHCEIAD